MARGRISLSGNFALAPGFSPEFRAHGAIAALAAFANVQPSRKRLKPFSGSNPLTTRLKPGANENSHFREKTERRLWPG